MQHLQNKNLKITSKADWQPGQGWFESVVVDEVMSD